MGPCRRAMTHARSESRFATAAATGTDRVCTTVIGMAWGAGANPSGACRTTDRGVTDAWRNGRVALRTCGATDAWRNGRVALRTRGATDAWRYGRVALRTCGATDVWRYGRVALYPSGQRTVFTVLLARSGWQTRQAASPREDASAGVRYSVPGRPSTSRQSGRW